MSTREEVAQQLAALTREVRALTEHLRTGPPEAGDMSGFGLKDELQRQMRRKEDKTCER